MNTDKSLMEELMEALNCEYTGEVSYEEKEVEVTPKSNYVDKEFEVSPESNYIGEEFDRNLFKLIIDPYETEEDFWEYNYCM